MCSYLPALEPLIAEAATAGDNNVILQYVLH